MNDNVIRLSPNGDYGVPFDIIGTGGVITEVQDNSTDTEGVMTTNFGINCWGSPVFRVGHHELDRVQAEQLCLAIARAIDGFDRCRFSSVVDA